MKPPEWRRPEGVSTAFSGRLPMEVKDDRLGTLR
jgi:hypothetical protein